MYYPVMLNVEGKKCVVIGGGTVALRKAEKLRECGGAVRCVSASFADGFETFDRVLKEYDKNDISGAFLVMAATDDRELNRRIASDAHGIGILSYAADDASCSDFILPASRTDGDITVTVSTNGKFPFLAKRLRDEIAENIGFYSELLPVLRKYREIVIEKNPENKREILKSFVSDEMIDAAKNDTELFERKIEEFMRDR